jgi:hypothetical protein
VFVLFNGTQIDDSNTPHIYYDEIRSGHHVDFGEQYTPNTGYLFCGSFESERIRWHYPNGSLIHKYRIYSHWQWNKDRTIFWTTVLRVADDTGNSPIGSDGLWTCRDNNRLEGAIHVGVYQRGRMFYSIIAGA